MTVEEIVNKVTEISVEYGPRLIGAIIVWIVGGIAIKVFNNGFVKLLEKNHTEPSLKSFLKSLVSVLLKLMLALSVLGMLGVQMTSFIAILGAAGLAVGMALSGTLQNFAGGVMILIFKPFKVGDVVEAQGFIGAVHDIQIFNTILKTPDNKTIIIPNGGLSTSAMINYSTEARRRVDWTFGIAYGDDAAKAKAVIKQLCDADSRILPDPEVFIAMSELADSSVNFVVRAWVNAGDYWGVYFDMNENIYNKFAEAGLTIPYPQMDLHMITPPPNGAA